MPSARGRQVVGNPASEFDVTSRPLRQWLEELHAIRNNAGSHSKSPLWNDRTMYAIAGVTGRTGKVIAETLQAKGERVRVVVRDETKGAPWKGRGAEVALADLDDDAALTRSLSGATGAYVLLPPDPITTDFMRYGARIADAIGRAAVKVALPHLVLLSSIGAHLPKGTGPIAALYQAERSFEKLGIGTT